MRQVEDGAAGTGRSTHQSIYPVVTTSVWVPPLVPASTTNSLPRLVVRTVYGRLPGEYNAKAAVTPQDRDGYP